MSVLVWALVPWIGVWIVVLVAPIPPPTVGSDIDYVWVRALLAVLAAIDGLALGVTIEYRKLLLWCPRGGDGGGDDGGDRDRTALLWVVVSRTAWSVVVMASLLALLIFQHPQLLDSDDDRRRRPWWAVTCAYLALVALEVVALCAWSMSLAACTARTLPTAASTTAPLLVVPPPRMAAPAA